MLFGHGHECPCRGALPVSEGHAEAGWESGRMALEKPALTDGNDELSASTSCVLEPSGRHANMTTTGPRPPPPRVLPDLQAQEDRPARVRWLEMR